MQFQDLKLIDPLLRAVREAGYETPTPIQQQAIPVVLQGKDLIGAAQTGTGKTAAFSLPILQKLAERPFPGRKVPIRVLILTPTRELASQIGDNIAMYGKHLRINHAVIFGGVGQNPQVTALRNGVEILVATPGRLLDLMGQGHVRLNDIEIFVLDEADRMLDMGFIHDVRRVIKALPHRRQNLLFSATMPQEIQDLANQMLHSPVMVEVTPQSTTVEKIAQSVYFVGKKEKPSLLIHMLKTDRSIRRVLVFTRTKHGANKVVEKLERAGIQAEAIHGNKSQTARERALANFKDGRTRVLVATDIASRGIDVDNVTHVINYDLPYEPESYVHRIGRTARAGASGIAIAFCDGEERKLLQAIEKLIRLKIPVMAAPEFAMIADTDSAGSRERMERSDRSDRAPRSSSNNGNRQNGNGQRRSSNGSSSSNSQSSGNRNGRSERPATSERAASSDRTSSSQRNSDSNGTSSGDPSRRRRRRRSGNRRPQLSGER
jgi:ATP-dependent RNA helicase RhlE